MTKLVEFTTDLRPWRKGDNVPVPDDLADRLVASGEAVNPRPFPTPEPSIADREIVRPPFQPETKPRKRYLTK